MDGYDVNHRRWRDPKWIVVAVLFATVIVRGFVLWVQFDHFEQDPDAYAKIAETIQTHQTFGLTVPEAPDSVNPTAFRPPLYPFLLSFFVTDGTLRHAAVALFHLVLATATVWFTLRASQKLIDGGKIGWPSIVASILVIVDPILLQQSTLVMTETIAAAIASGVIWFWATHFTRCPTIAQAAVFGFLLSLAYLCRPTFLVWAVCLLPGILLGIEASRLKRTLLLLTTATILVLTVGLWTARNLRIFGHPIWATTHGGYTLLLANNPSFYDYLRHGAFGTPWDAEPFFKAYAPADNVGEVEQDKIAYEAAKQTIRTEPAMFAWSCVVRVARLWSPMPHHTAERSWVPIILVTVYYTGLLASVLIGGYRMRRQLLRSPWLPIVALVFTLSAVHAVYWSNMRMRAPATTALAIVAASLLSRRESVVTEAGVKEPKRIEAR